MLLSKHNMSMLLQQIQFILTAYHKGLCDKPQALKAIESLFRDYKKNI